MRIADCGLRNDVGSAEKLARDVELRELYARAALAQIPRLLGAIDRNPYRPTYGCCDRQFWHYRTSDFPSEMYQEAAWPLALVYSHALPDNGWQGEPRVRELAIAALRYSARSCHRDGSCDDYYPYERALGAAVFSLLAAARTYRLLELDDGEIMAYLERRATWIAAHEESGRLSNHHALAALGLLHVASLTGKRRYRLACEERLHRLLSWQSSEGWFEEYGGADPGYQTVTIDCLAKCRYLLDAEWLDEPIARGVQFCRLFLHPDFSYGGEYGSRGTYHFYPHGFELLAANDSHAADLADGFLQALSANKQACFDDDRLVAHRLGSLIEAYLDWSPDRPAEIDEPPSSMHYLPHARLLVHRTAASHTIVSAARGGVIKHFQKRGQAPFLELARNTRKGSNHETGSARGPAVSGSRAACVTDAGLIVELCDGRIAVSQSHDLSREVAFRESPLQISVGGPLHVARFETATPLKFVLLRLGMLLAGRWRRTLVRSLLQKRLITGRRECPVQLTRSVEFLEGGRLRITDLIELTHAGVRVRRLSFGVDHQAAYVAASGVYQDAILQPWQDLSDYVERLNHQRRIEIVRHE